MSMRWCSIRLLHLVSAIILAVHADQQRESDVVVVVRGKREDVAYPFCRFDPSNWEECFDPFNDISLILAFVLFFLFVCAACCLFFWLHLCWRGPSMNPEADYNEALELERKRLRAYERKRGERAIQRSRSSSGSRSSRSKSRRPKRGSRGSLRNGDGGEAVPDLRQDFTPGVIVSKEQLKVFKARAKRNTNTESASTVSKTTEDSTPRAPIKGKNK